MNLGSYLVSATAYMASLYKKSPVKPFTPLLSKLYFNVLNTGQGASVVHKNIDGINFELDLREVIDSEMFYCGSREPKTSRTLELICDPSDVVIDIGANVGSHALPMAKLVGPSGRVYAFEPVPWAMDKLKRNASLNGFSNIVTEQVALSDENLGHVDMEFRASFKIGSAIGVDDKGRIDKGWWQECDHVSTEMRTLDSYVTGHDIRRVDLIKLDVDGFEGKVIRGARETLSRFKPVIIMELAPAWVEMRGDSCIAIAMQLRDMGYRCFAEVTFDEILDVDKLILDIKPGQGFNVVYATHKPMPRSQAAS